jgi:hypothetical protein
MATTSAWRNVRGLRSLLLSVAAAACSGRRTEDRCVAQAPSGMSVGVTSRGEVPNSSRSSVIAAFSLDLDKTDYNSDGGPDLYVGQASHQVEGARHRPEAGARSGQNAYCKRRRSDAWRKIEASSIFDTKPT